MEVRHFNKWEKDKDININKISANETCKSIRIPQIRKKEKKKIKKKKNNDWLKEWMNERFWKMDMYLWVCVCGEERVCMCFNLLRVFDYL